MIRHQRQGQAAVFVALCLMALLLVIAFATNTGIVTNDRIRMQETADLATYAVAYSEAASLNDITEANQDIAEAVRECRDDLTGRIWDTPCNCGPTDPWAEWQLELCKMEIDAAIYRFTSIASYSRTVKKALQAGRATAGANFTGTEAHTSFFEKFPGSPTSATAHWVSYAVSDGPGGRFTSIAPFEQVRDTAFNYQFVEHCDECEVTGIAVRSTVHLPTWFYKDSQDPDIWVAGRVAGTPEKRFLDTDFRAGGADKGYFGASSMGGDDLLVSYAVAKPYDGSVGPTALPSYLRSGNIPAGWLYIGDSGWLAEETMVDEYRARMAGIQDDLAGPAAPTTLIALDGAVLGKSWDTSKFEH